MSEQKHYIDELLDDDPIVDNCNTIGFIESLIWNSLFCDRTRIKMEEKINSLKESELGDFIYNLKLNQNIRDPKHQWEKMVKDGVFDN
jgi:hypothetical protein